MATVFKPAVTKSGIMFLFFTTKVIGPGENFFARRITSSGIYFAYLLISEISDI